MTGITDSGLFAGGDWQWMDTIGEDAWKKRLPVAIRKELYKTHARINHEAPFLMAPVPISQGALHPDVLSSVSEIEELVGVLMVWVDLGGNIVWLIWGRGDNFMIHPNVSWWPSGYAVAAVPGGLWSGANSLLDMPLEPIGMTIDMSLPKWPGRSGKGWKKRGKGKSK